MGAMESRSGSDRRLILVPLLLALTFGAAAAAQPSSDETVWRNARLAIDRGQPAAAAKMVDEALQRAGSRDDAIVWELRTVRAFLFTQAGDHAAAAKILSQPLPEKLRNSEAAVRRLIQQAMLSWSQDRAAALGYLDKAHQIATSHARGALAEILYRKGQVTRDEAAVREAIRLAKKAGDEIVLVKAEAALMYTLAHKQQFAEAVNLGEVVRVKMEKLGLAGVRKTHVGNLGWYYSELGDYDRAAELLANSIAEAERMGDLNQLPTWSTTLSTIHLIRRDWQQAIQHCERALRATVNLTHRSRADAMSALARAYLETGRIDDARRVVRQAIALEKDPEDTLAAHVVEARIHLATRDYAAAAKALADVIRKTERPTTLLAARGQLAQVYAASNDRERASQNFQKALEQVRTTRATVQDRDLRLFFFNTTSELYDNYVDFLVSTGQVEDALRVTETSRAQTLAEELGVPSPDKIDPRKVARQHNAVILSYWLGRQRSYVWTVTPADVKVATLEENDFAIEKLVETYRRQLLTTAGTLERSGAGGRKLYDLLVARAVQGLPRGARVIVVPDDKLHTLNFETLVVPGSRPHYWIEDVVLANASSLQLLARDGAKAAPQPKMLLVGNPPTAGADFPALQHAGDEIGKIARQFAGRATVLAGPKATPANYTAARPQTFDYVHFVAHGVASRARPLDSAVILGPDPNSNYRLVARDIAKQSINARLVTISSCYGAGAATYAGEGQVGLAWAFLHAGADQVVAALWAVRDSAAPKLMDHMYAGIRAGKDPAVALRDAKLALLTSGNSLKHPLFWAPFVIYQ